MSEIEPTQARAFISTLQVTQDTVKRLSNKERALLLTAIKVARGTNNQGLVEFLRPYVHLQAKGAELENLNQKIKALNVSSAKKGFLKGLNFKRLSSFVSRRSSNLSSSRVFKELLQFERDLQQTIEKEKK